MGVALRAPRVPRPALLAAGLVLAVAAAAAAPTSPLLSGPDTVPEIALATAVFAAVFAVGFLFPSPMLFGFVLVAALEGAFRKWLVNDVTVFLVKDFLLLGVYAAVLPSLSRAQLRRPWWLLAPVAAYAALALLYVPASDTWQHAAIGLRSYLIYVPLLWVAPALLPAARPALRFALLVVAIGVCESLLGTVQALTGNEWLNTFVDGTIPALITHEGTSYLRPTGTFLQVGTYAAFLIFAILGALALVVAATDRRRLAIGLGSASLLAWGFTFASSRALGAATLLAAVAAVGLLLVRRRWLAALALPVAIALGMALLSILPLGGAARSGADAHFLRNETVKYLDADGRVVERTFSFGSGDTEAVAGYVDKATTFSATDVANGVPTNRITAQLDVISDQRLIGHGTGTMTLGTEYAVATAALHGEGQYTKAAWELGLPGLVVLCALLAGVAFGSVLGVLRVRGDAWVPVLVGAGAALVLPLWATLVFVFDFPIAGALYFAFGGIAVAAGCGAWPSSGSTPDEA